MTPTSIDEVIHFLNYREPFSFSRWGDGEFAALFGDSGQNCDGVKYAVDMEAELWSIIDSKPTYSMGKQPYHKNLYNAKRIQQIEELDIDWCNADTFHDASKNGQLKPFLISLSNRKVYIIGNGRLRNLQTFFDFTFIQTPSTDAWSNREAILEQIPIEKNSVYLFACGITSNWLIDRLHGKATLIDIGSLLDPFAGDKTRNYHRFVNLRQATPIHVTMATTPIRSEFAKIAVDSILNCNVKPDSFHIELNGFNEVPDWVINRPVTYTLRKENIGAKAKFARLDSVKGYYLTVDDDIEYDKSYIGHLTNWIDAYGRFSFVGIHGSTHRTPKIRSYWNDSARRYHFQGKLSSNVLCSMLGTGTLGFHTSIGLTYDVFEQGNMTDPYLSKWAILNNVKQVCLSRPDNYCKQIAKSQDTGKEIWKSAMNNDTEQTEVINSIGRVNFRNYLLRNRI